jgi:hypothetical protein
LLERDPSDLLTAAGYGTLRDRDDEVPLPVRPRATVLPVAELSPDRFEEFVADIARRLFPDVHVSGFGGQGHRQYGFDVVAQGAEGFPAGFQCKRRRQFGPEDVRAAVSAAQLAVERAFIVLTRVASPDCRVEMARHSSWTLWDVEDLSREVRALPLAEAVRIVDTYFPGWREALLGVADPGPWLQPDEFFRPLASSRVYSHDWLLVGRDDQLASLLEFLNASDRVGCVVGRGGIGKTRLLREVSVRASAGGIEVRFVTTGADVTAEHFELLPSSGSLLVIIDDAHERSDLAVIVRSVVERNSDARVILSLRPYGLGLLASDLRHIGVHPSELPRWELGDLTADDAEALARQALGLAASGTLVRRLADVTADCPLITVVAGVLIERGQLAPACLDHEETLRGEVLRAFRDVLVSDPIGGDAATRRAVLDAVSALQPFRSDEPSFQAALSQLVGVQYDRAIAHLRGLEDAGVLLRRAAALRVVPDLLGDVVLTEACFDDRSGASTGYIERAVELAETGPLQNVFVNASRIDWQIRHDRDDAPALTGTLWRQVDTEFAHAGILGRRRILELLRRVAHFAPEPTLALVRQAIAMPTDVVEDVGDLEAALLRLHPLTYEDVLHELPALLRGVGYHLDCLPEVLDILWGLARVDDRPANQYPNHAFRVLRDLAEVEPGKPLAYNRAVIDAAERWLEEPSTETEHSAFDVLEPMLVTEGMEHRAHGYKLVFKPFVLTPESIAPLRGRILDLAFQQLTSTDIAAAVRAADAIGHSLRYPHGYFGQDTEKHERNTWTPEFVAVLDHLAESVAQLSVDPVVLIAIRRAIRWHADFSGTETQSAARRVRDAMPWRPEDQVAIALVDGWGQLSENRLQGDFEKARAEREERTRGLADALAKAETNEGILQLLEERLKAQQALAAARGNPGPFVWCLVTARPSLGVAVADRLIAEPASPLLDVLPIALAALAEHAATEFMPAIEALLAQGNARIRQQVAQGLGWNRGARVTLLPGELDVLVRLAVDSDVSVRMAVVRAAQQLARDHPEEAVRLLGQVPFADSSSVAEELFQTFGPHGDLDWRNLPPAEIRRLLDELEQCPSIEEYWITSFLSEFSSERPEELLELLQRRIDRWEEQDPSTGYSPLPFSWNSDLRFRDGNIFAVVLRRVRDWIAAKPDSWSRRQAGADLFTAVAGAFDETVLDVLEEGATVGDDAEIVAVASILREAPRAVVFENVDFVRRLLRLAAQRGEERVRLIVDALFAAAAGGMRTGIAGEPFAQDLAQRDRAREIADAMPEGSAVQRLYRSLQESAERSIQWHADRDELMDGRQW